MSKRVELSVPFQLASVWTPTLQRCLSGWLMSEKLDGIRAMWDGRGNLLSRNGVVFKSPPQFTSILPRGIYLDGELWIDRQMFADVVSIVRSRPENWTMLRFKIFDGYCQKNWTYQERLDACANIVGNDSESHVSIIDHHQLCDGSVEEISSHLSSILSLNGEGIILRDPTAKYSSGRKCANLSPMLKVKPELDDEAIVVEHNIRIGRKGSLVVCDRGGRIFKIASGIRDTATEPCPPVGSTITFAYDSRNESTGIPRFPRYIRRREDMEFLNPEDTKYISKY
jgi:DNA ligase-1